jgi:ketosteroid isomerase-like protein
MSNFVTTLALSLSLATATFAPRPALAEAIGSAQQVADDLLATDRAFSAAAMGTDLVSGLGAMFDDEIVMPLPDATFARGREAAVAALRANPANLTSRAGWTPVRAGISADGRHGFTFGFMTTRLADGAERPGKYLAYWVRRPGGWRVAVYKRVGRPAGDVSMASMAPSLPAATAAASPDPATRERQSRGLRDAEQAFSDNAQRIGIGPAFREAGAPDAMNMGAEAGFAIGNETIGNLVASPAPGSPVSWSSDGVLVAASGDLGVSWGMIRSNGPVPEGRPAAAPFFTIWRRAAPDQPWRYIAE